MKAKLKPESHTLLGKSNWFWLRFSLHPFNHGRQPIEFSPNPFKSTKKHAIFIWLVVWNGTWFLFFHILRIKFPTDVHIFQRGWSTTNQLRVFTIFSSIFCSWFSSKEKSPTPSYEASTVAVLSALRRINGWSPRARGCPPSTPPQAVHKGDEDLKQ